MKISKISLSTQSNLFTYILLHLIALTATTTPKFIDPNIPKIITTTTDALNFTKYPAYSHYSRCSKCVERFAFANIYWNNEHVFVCVSKTCCWPTDFNEAGKWYQCVLCSVRGFFYEKSCSLIKFLHAARVYNGMKIFARIRTGSSGLMDVS